MSDFYGRVCIVCLRILPVERFGLAARTAPGGTCEDCRGATPSARARGQGGYLDQTVALRPRYRGGQRR